MSVKLVNTCAQKFNRPIISRRLGQSFTLREELQHFLLVLEDVMCSRLGELLPYFLPNKVLKTILEFTNSPRDLPFLILFSKSKVGEESAFKCKYMENIKDANQIMVKLLKTNKFSTLHAIDKRINQLWSQIEIFRYNLKQFLNLYKGEGWRWSESDSAKVITRVSNLAILKTNLTFTIFVAS